MLLKRMRGEKKWFYYLRTVALRRRNFTPEGEQQLPELLSPA
jgi:hypothetical protein